MGMSRKKVGVILAGCGWLDGSEIQEAICALLALDQRDTDVLIMAPDVPQMHVVDHLNSAPVEGTTRNVLLESARIARGDVVDVATVHADDLDALIVPGGFGAAKNLCTFAVDGSAMQVNTHVAQLVREMHRAGKPQGFICIAPVIAAKVLGADHGIELTIGNDQETAHAITAMGARHIQTAAGGCHVDEEHKIVTTPAYMLGPSIAQVHQGIDTLVSTVLALS
jgi:enhancing lycopene biosynthesis protein 2